MGFLVSACISYQIVASIVTAQNDTTIYIDNSQKALITVGVLGGAIVVAVIVAKIVDYCYDHRIAISDDDSDISESTRDLIRMRLALTAFKKKTKTGEKDKDKDDVEAKQRKIIRIWSAKAKESRRIAEQRRAEDNAKRLAGRNDQFIKVQEAAKDGKMVPGLAGAADTLVIVSEKSENPARRERPPTSKPPANKDEKRCSQNALLSTFPARPELERTLTGLDSSTSLPEVPAVVVVCTSGNESVLPGKESNVPDSGAKAKAKPIAVDVRGAPSAGHSVAEPGTAALTDRSEGSKSPGPKSQGSRSPGPKSPGPKSPSRGSPGPKSPGPKSPSRGSPGPKSPGPKSPSPKPPAPKTPAKSPSPNRAASPVKNSGEAKTEATSKPEESSSAAASSPANDHTDRQAESAGGEAPPGNGNPESHDSPNGSHQPRPTSSTSRRLFTVVRQKSQQASPSRTKTPQPTGDDSKGAAAAAGGAATASSPSKVGPKSSKPRPKSVVIKEDPKLSNMPPKMSKSVAVYGQASSELKVHKDMVSKKKAAVSPERAGNAAAGKTSRTKSAKS